MLAGVAAREHDARDGGLLRHYLYFCTSKSSTFVPGDAELDVADGFAEQVEEVGKVADTRDKYRRSNDIYLSMSLVFEEQIVELPLDVVGLNRLLYFGYAVLFQKVHHLIACRNALGWGVRFKPMQISCTHLRLELKCQNFSPTSWDATGCDSRIASTARTFVV